MDSPFDQQSPWSTDTAVAESPRIREKIKVPFDSVPVVDPTAVFEEVVFRSAEVKLESQSDADYKAGKQKQQKVNKDGVPVWSLKLAAVMKPSGNYREREDDIKVSWSSRQHPNEVFHRYEPVELVGLRFGVTEVKRRDGSVSSVVYWTAQDVRPAEASKPLRTAS